MAKALRTAALVVGAVALVATGVGALAGAGALGAAAAGTTGAVAGISTATIAAVGTYASLAAGALSLASAAAMPGQTVQGSATTFATNPQSGLPYAMGRTRMSGLRFFAATSSRPGYTKFNDLLWFGALLSIGGAIDSIESFKADGVAVTFDAGGNAVGQYRDYMGQAVHLGGPQSAALNLVVGGGTAPGWTSQHRLSGITHAMWCLRFNKEGEMYGAGAPEPAWTGKWVKVYDPRLDSTYPGGSGPCRALDETTYVWSDNPGLHALTWALGRWQNGRRTCGIGAPIANIRVAEFVECANICDANRWKVGGVEWTTDSKWATMKRILQAGGARPTKSRGMIGCLVSAPRTAIATIESRHLLDKLQLNVTKTRRDRYNTVIPRYVDENSDWAVISGSAVQVTTYVAADRGQRTKEIDYPLVQVFAGEEAKQPAELAAYDIVNSREGGPFTWSTGPEWIGIKTGDVINLNVPEEGLVNQPMLVTKATPDPATGKISFAGETETHSKHDFALGRTTTPPAPFTLTAPDLKPPPPATSSWAVTGATTGEGLPAIIVIGTSDMPSADAILLEYRKAGEDAWSRPAILSATGQILHVISPLESTTVYEVRVGYRVGPIDGSFALIGTVTTGVGKLSGIEDGATVGGTVGENIFLPELPDVPAPPGLLRNDLLKLRKDGGLVYRPYGDPAVEVELGKIGLPDIGAASEAARRQLDDAIDRLGTAVSQAITEAGRTRETFRDAGFYVDPATGIVRISAIDQTAEQLSEAYIRLSAAESAITLRATKVDVANAIAEAVLDPSQVPVFQGLEIRVTSAELRLDGAEAAINQKATIVDLNAQGARLSTAEQDIDALKGQILLKVDTVEFDGLGQRVTSAEQALEAFGDSASIRQAVVVARRLPEDLGKSNEGVLRALLAGDAARRGQLTAMASARQELTAKINDDLTAESRSRLELVVKVGAMEASALTETQARVEGDRAVAQQVTDLSASIAGQLASFDQRIVALVQNDDLIVAGLTTTVSAVRGLGEDAASAAESALNALLTGDRSRRDAAGALAAAREEVTAKVNADIDAVVQRVSAVLVRMGAAEASIVAEELARVTANLAIVSQISQINASVEKNAADIFNEAVARADAIGAQASRIDGLSARLGEAGTAGAIEALISAAASAYVQPLSAQAGRLDTVEARIGAPDTPGSIEARLVAASNAYADPLLVQAGRTDAINARLGAPNTPGALEARLDAASQAYIGPLGVVAQRTDSIVARIGEAGSATSIEAKVEEQRLALVDVNGKLVAYFRIAATDPDGTTYVEIMRSNGTGKIVLGGDVLAKGVVTADNFVNNAAIVPAFVYSNDTIAGPGWGGGPWDGGGNGGVGSGGGGGGGRGGQIP